MISFTSPLLLLGLVALPILWLILRAVPPAPIQRRFPGVALLLGLTDNDAQTDRTPWWLLMLRLLAVASLIIGFAEPVLNPQTNNTSSGDLVILMDGSWAGATGQKSQTNRIDALIADAGRSERRTAVLSLAELPVDGTIPFATAKSWSNRLINLEPQPWQPPQNAADWFGRLTDRFETIWFSDGLDWEGRAELLSALEARGPVKVIQTPRTIFALRPAQFDAGKIVLSANRATSGSAVAITVNAIGRDPAGVERQLDSAIIDFAAGDSVAQTRLAMPPELRNRITRFEISGQRSAGAVTLADDALTRREIALIAGRDDREGLELLSPLHYLREALEPTADLIEGASIADILLANPDVIILADVANLSETQSTALAEWVSQGGHIVRFAGPLMAASDPSSMADDPLLPVRLRSGGRSIGGAMSWGEPKSLAEFQDGSPFVGLEIPTDVAVSSQVIAQPDPTLAARVIAQLTDGTPLVTRKTVDEGQIILFHVTANAEWSTLPLSGLFVQMLERLAISTRPVTGDAEALQGTTWLPRLIMDGYGKLEDGTALAGVDGDNLADAEIGPNLRPGLYTHEAQTLALNVANAQTALTAAEWPARIPVEGLDVPREVAIKGWFLAAALAFLALDCIASLAVGGRLRGPLPNAAVLLFAVSLFGIPEVTQAQDELAIRATSQVVLGHVLTGDSELDQIAQAGLYGLSRTLFRRSSIEPANPLGVNLEQDELAFFPFLYWPVSADQPLPSRSAFEKLNRYLRSGGMILFDTRDADTAQFGSGSPEGRKLQAIARSLDIPAIEPIPSDHVLTRTFYLLQVFPGRYAGRDIWVEAAPLQTKQADGLPFRNLNDGVTPVVIGGNDWARAWAIDENGNKMFPVGRGQAGERQREYALRFGVNLIMHVLTGNYKSDQVHVPALLDRLGQ